MDNHTHSRTQSVLSARSSGLQIRASKIFSKFKLHSKSKSTNASPYLDMPLRRPTSPTPRTRESMKPYMSQPVLGLTMNQRKNNEDDALPSPASNSGTSSGNDPFDVPTPKSRTNPPASWDGRPKIETSLSTSKFIPTASSQPDLHYSTDTPSQPTPRTPQTVHQEPSILPMDGLPNSINSTSDSTLSGLPTSQSHFNDSQGASGIEGSTLRPSSGFRPPVPSRAPPPPPLLDVNDNQNSPTPSLSVTTPSIVISRTPSQDLWSRSSVYSTSSELTNTDGYATAPSSPPSSVLNMNGSPTRASHSNTQISPTTSVGNENTTSPATTFIPEVPVIYDEPVSIVIEDSSHDDQGKEMDVAHLMPDNSQAPLGRKSPAPRLTDILPPPILPSRTFNPPTPPEKIVAVHSEGANSERLHRKFSTAPGRRGSVILTPSGEAVRFSPSVITYQRLPPGAMKLPPTPSATVDEYGRRLTSPSTPSSSWNGFQRGLSEGSSSFWRSSSGSVSRRATLREMPAMSVGGEIDNGDDGDHEHSDESDDDSDDDVNDVDDDATTTSMASSTPSEKGIQHESSRTRRLWSFSSIAGKGQGPIRQDSSSTVTPTITAKEPAFVASLDPKGKGKAREVSDQNMTVSPSWEPTIKKAGRSADFDYFPSKALDIGPSLDSTKLEATVTPPKSPSGSNASTKTLSRSSEASVPLVPPIPRSDRMPPMPVHGDNGRPTLYKHASHSMFNILPPQEDLSLAPPKSPVDEDNEEDVASTALDKEHPPSWEAATRERNGSVLSQEPSPLLNRRRSMPTFGPSTDPPPYPAFPPGPYKSHPGFTVHPREDEGNEELPPYTNSIFLKAIMPMKMEFSAPSVQAKDRKWKRVLCVLEGTVFKVYRCRVGKGIPGGVGTFESWWEGQFGAGDASATAASAIVSIAKVNREREKEIQRSLEAVRKIEAESGNGVPASGSTTEVVLPRSSSQADSLLASTSSLSSSPNRLPMRPHTRSRSDVSAMSRGSTQGSPRSSLNVARGGVGGRVGGRMSVDVDHAGGSRSSLSLSLQSPSGSGNVSASTSGSAGLHSSNSSIYSSHNQSLTSSITDAIPDPDPADLIRAFTMQEAESGLASDYLKRRNVIRARLEKTQFLLQASDVSEVVDWIEALHASANVALDLDARPMPKGPLFPRRRRRRRRTQQGEEERGQQQLNINGGTS